MATRTPTQSGTTTPRQTSSGTAAHNSSTRLNSAKDAGTLSSLAKASPRRVGSGFGGGVPSGRGRPTTLPILSVLAGAISGLLAFSIATSLFRDSGSSSYSALNNEQARTALYGSFFDAAAAGSRRAGSGGVSNNGNCSCSASAPTTSSAAAGQGDRPPRPRPKPRFILHVGPAKTATTTIQHDLAVTQTQELEAGKGGGGAGGALARDGYAYLGKYISPQHVEKVRARLEQDRLDDPCKDEVAKVRGGIRPGSPEALAEAAAAKINAPVTDALELPCYRAFWEKEVASRPFLDATVHRAIFDDRQCHAEIEKIYLSNGGRTFTGPDDPQIPACWKVMMEDLDRRYARNESIILSNEDFSFGRFHDPRLSNKVSYWAALQIAVRKFDVTVVIAYRRYSEWLVSSKKQHDKECMITPAAKEWPHNNGTPCHEPIWTTLKKYRSGQRRAYKFHFTDQNIDLFERYFPNSTRILNHHEDWNGRPITSIVLCDILQDAPTACRHSLNQLEETTHNPKMDTHYEAVVFQAAQKGLIEKTTARRRQDVVAELRGLQQQSRREPSDLPMECPSVQELQALLDESLDLERRLLPDFYTTPDGETKHRAEFWHQAAVKKDFCEVDTKTLFRNKNAWGDVLASLGADG